MTSVARWQDNQAWAQAEIYGWLWASLDIDVPGPDDPGTNTTLEAIARSLGAADPEKERIGALLMEVTFAARALIHALADASHETPEAALARLLPGPPDPGRGIGGGPI